MSTARRHDPNRNARAVDAAEISRMLAERIESLCRTLLPAGCKESGSWRVGDIGNNKGSSLSVALTGAKQGLWFDHATGQGGDVLDLIAATLWLDMREAIIWARQWLGVERASGRESSSGHIPTAGRAKAASTATQTQATANQRALGLWRCRRPVIGTIAETYLRAARGYGGPIPATLGFLPGLDDHPPALIAAFGMATEPEPGVLAIADGDVKAVQLVKLKPDGSWKADVDPNKIIVGQGALGVPIILAPPNDLLGMCITEGIEDALSIHAATGLGAWAAGGWGRMSALAVSVSTWIGLVTVRRDDDEVGVRGATALAAALARRGIKHAINPPLDEAGA